MIAMKREVAVLQKKDKQGQVFRGANVKLGNWRQVTVSQSDLPDNVEIVEVLRRHTRESVQSPLVVLKSKVRKGGDFFYGKSSNENHIKGV